MTGILQRIGRIKLHNQILIGLVLGAALGPWMGDVALAIKPVGDAFINLLIMVGLDPDPLCHLWPHDWRRA